MKMRKLYALLLALLMLSACGETPMSAAPETSVQSEVQEEPAAEPTTEPDASAEEFVSAAEDGGSTEAVTASSDWFTDRELDPSYDEAETITLKDGGSQSDSAKVNIVGDTITITGEGVYEVSGALSDGMIIVDAEKTDKVQLVLDGVDIHSDSSAAIYVAQADKVFLTLTGDNSLSSGETYVAIDENNIDAAIFSKDDLVLNGSGSLTVTAPVGHGVVSKDDLVVAGGSYTITAASSGLSGQDSVKIAAGSFTIDSGKDAIHAENDDVTLGIVYVEAGEFTLNADGDGISASGALQIEGGDFQVTTGGGCGAAPQTDENGDTVSAKGLKTGGDMILNGGNFTLDCADDAVHGNGNITVSGGDFTIASGDDGIHADGDLTVSDGTILISQCYEGLEGNLIEISGGDIDITAQDDGLNAAGGADGSGMGGHGGWDAVTAATDSFSGDQPEIRITGGTLTIDSEGDSIDSNASFYIEGGDITLYGPVAMGNGMLDYNVEGVITGGSVIGMGPSSMAENFSGTSTQGAILLMVGSQSAGTDVTLTDAAGNVLMSGTAKKDYSAVIFSCGSLEQGATYTITAGSYTEEITLDSLIYGTGGGFGGRGGH